MAKADNRHGNARAWQRMLSGRRLDLLDLSPLDIEITDIAPTGLSMSPAETARHTASTLFSVAQNSLLVEQIFFPHEHLTQTLMP